MKYFGFFEGTNYDICEGTFEDYQKIKNKLDKEVILDYLKSLQISAICPMTARDMFTGEMIENAGIYEDGDFTFPTDFIYYYERYDIGIPLDYERYIASKIL